MRFWYRTVSLALAGLLAVTPLAVSAAEKTVSSEDLSDDLYAPLEAEAAPAVTAAELQITSRSAILVEQTTGKILFEQNAHEALSPASVTKVMSLLLVMEALERGDLTPETEITASEHASSMGGSQIWLKEGEVMTVHDLLKAAAIASANDATVALAEAVAGSEEAFVARMNERAAELGMTDTVFKNATGLDAEGHVTSAYDIARMSCALLAHPKILEYSTVWMDTLRGGASELVNTNKLVRFYEGATGLKTGTTSRAGYCLSASATREGLSLVAVVMDAPSSKVRFNEARALLNYGFAGYTFLLPDLPAEATAPVAVERGVVSAVPVEPEGSLSVLVPKLQKDQVTVEVSRTDHLQAPVRAGQTVGTCRVMAGEEELACLRLVAAEDVEARGFGYLLGLLLAAIASL